MQGLAQKHAPSSKFTNLIQTELKEDVTIIFNKLKVVVSWLCAQRTRRGSNTRSLDNTINAQEHKQLFMNQRATHKT